MHHLIIGKLNQLFEKQFIHDSYSCRTDKGTHFGIQRIDKFIRQCSLNYTKDCYILKLDIQGFFMSINKNILYRKLENFIIDKYTTPDKDLLLKLSKQIIYNDSTKNCIIKGNRTDWNDLPPSKSLFHSAENVGLPRRLFNQRGEPIGNLTSQIFANFYMDTFDHYIKHDLKIKYYGRYVDDFVIVHNDLEYLKSLIPTLSNYLLSTLQLTLHPKKIYLQHYTKGVKFLGTVILPNRIYLQDRTVNNLKNSIYNWNIQIRQTKKLTATEKQEFQSSINSYLGIAKHYNTYNIRQRLLKENLSAYFFNYFYISGGYCKLTSKIRRVKNRRNMITQ